MTPVASAILMAIAIIVVMQLLMSSGYFDPAWLWVGGWATALSAGAIAYALVWDAERVPDAR